MPHILIEGFDTDKNVRGITLHADVWFSTEYIRSEKYKAKLCELQTILEKTVSEYFENYTSDIFQEHEFNKMMK